MNMRRFISNGTMLLGFFGVLVFAAQTSALLPCSGSDCNGNAIPDACEPDPNYYLEFDGENDSLLMPASASLDLRGISYTWEFSAYRQATGTSENLLAIGDHVNPTTSGDLLHIKWGGN